jgi:DNA-binding transcriptional regulator YiaG
MEANPETPPEPQSLITARAQTLTRGRGREIRERAGLSLADMSADLDVPVSTMSAWERGIVRRIPTERARRWLELCEQLERVVGAAS